MLDLNFFGFVVCPSYTVQRKGVMSDDGLGWTWQCNVFGHYILVRAPYVFHMRKELTTASARTHTHVWCLVQSIRGKACGVADRTRARRLDVLIHGRGAHI